MAYISVKTLENGEENFKIAMPGGVMTPMYTRYNKREWDKEGFMEKTEQPVVNPDYFQLLKKGLNEDLALERNG